MEEDSSLVSSFLFLTEMGFVGIAGMEEALGFLDDIVEAEMSMGD